MMIASHIRKNKQDNQLRTYLKEMAKLRKDDRRYKVFSKISDIANRRQQMDAKKKLQGKLTDVVVDRDTDNETCQPLVSKDTNEEATDSVYVQPDRCISPDSQSPSLSDIPYNSDSGRVTSLSFHGNGRRKSNGGRSATIQDCKTVNIHERSSPNFDSERSIMFPLDTRSPSLNNFQLSPIFGRKRSSTIPDIQLTQGKHHQIPASTDVKLHRHTEPKHPSKTGEKKSSWPISFHIVDENAIL